MLKNNVGYAVEKSTVEGVALETNSTLNVKEEAEMLSGIDSYAVEKSTVESVVSDKSGVVLKTVELIGVSNLAGEGLQARLRIWDYVNNQWNKASISFKKLTAKTICNLIQDNNGYCPDGKVIYQFIMSSFNSALTKGKLEHTNQHRKLGWDIINNCPVFYGKDAITLVNGYKSEYVGPVDIEPTGNLEEVINMIETHIINKDDWSPLQAVLAFAASATVLAYLNTVSRESLDNIIIHILGDSATGKSTALKLYTSFASNPNSKKGLLINYEGSSEAIIKRIGQNKGYPVAIDELSQGSAKDYTRLVYAIGNGKEKDRLKPNGSSFQHSSSYNTVVMSSGEISLWKKCSKCTGIKARSVEISNIKWTTDKYQSEAIKECVSFNYGLITPLISSELINNGDKWNNRWKYWKEVLSKKLDKEKVKLGVSSRVSDFVALFALSAEILNEALGIELDVNKIFDFTYLNIIPPIEDEANLGVRGYEVIKEYISANKDKFLDATFYGYRTSEDDINLPNDYDGFFYEGKKSRVINGCECNMIYVFRRSKFNEILDNAGYADSKVVLNSMFNDKLLLTKDNTRYTKPFSINSTEVQCIAIYCENETYKALMTGVTKHYFED